MGAVNAYQTRINLLSKLFAKKISKKCHKAKTCGVFVLDKAQDHSNCRITKENDI